MNRCKRILATALAICLTLTLLPAAALAEEVASEGLDVLTQEELTLLETPQEELSLADQLRQMEVGETYRAALNVSTFALGDEGTPFIIANAGQLADLATFVNAGNGSYNAAHYKMVADIDLSAYSNWTPIGTSDKNFKGVFDGGGHTISGLKIHTEAHYQGLFGMVDGTSQKAAQVKNVIVKNADVKGGMYVGALVGAYGSTRIDIGAFGNTYNMDYCAMVGGRVEGKATTGGLVGSSHATISECYSTGTVVGIGSSGDLLDKGTGGVVGAMGGDSATMSACYSTGNVSGTGTVGGVVGTYGWGNIKDCYSTGNVSGNASGTGTVGGVVGNSNFGGEMVGNEYDFELINCVALGRSVKAEKGNAGRLLGGSRVKSVLKNCYAWSGMKDATYAAGEGNDLSYSNNQLDSGIFETQFTAWNPGSRTTLPTLKNVGGEQSNALPTWITTTTTETPIYITSAQELAELATAVNSDAGGYAYHGKTILLANDIDLSAYDNWKPIGQDNRVFAGVFDGQGHTITGLTVNRAGESGCGLFGAVKGAGTPPRAQVKNVIIKDATIIGDNQVGAVVGSYGHLTEPLTGCAMIGGSVTGVQTMEIGGVAGVVDTTIENCYATGSVTATQPDAFKVGGVAGYALKMNTCYATGGVAGKTYTGGVVGVAAVVTNCVALNSSVSGSGENVGRVCGAIENGIDDGNNKIPGSISNCFGWRGITGARYEKGAGADIDCIENALDDRIFQDSFTSDKGWVPGGFVALPTLTKGSAAVQSNALPPWLVSPDDTISITTAAELAQIASNVNSGANTYYKKTVRLEKDISLSAYQTGIGWTPIGTLDHPFEGTFDGQGHSVTGLFINNPTADYQGLLGNADGTIQNVILKNYSVTGGSYVGGVVGAAGTISSCAAAGRTSGSVIGSVTGKDNVGSVAGKVSGEISNCYATGNVKGENNVGGVVGNGAGTVKSCYATGEVVGKANVAGVAGFVVTNVENCVALNSLVQSDSGSPVGRVFTASSTVRGGYAWSFMKMQGNLYQAGAGSDLAILEGFLQHDGARFAWEGFDAEPWSKPTQAGTLPTLAGSNDTPTFTTLAQQTMQTPEIDYTNEILTKFEKNAEVQFKIGGGETQTKTTTETGTLGIEPSWFGKTFSPIVPPTTSEITVVIPNRPAAPTFVAMSDDANTYTFQGISGVTYEYQIGDGTWTDITAGNTNTVIPVGRVAVAVGGLKVRAKLTSTSFVGDVLTNATAFTADLEGSVVITGTAAYGSELTATATGYQTGAVLSYRWLTGETELQSDASNTYRIQSAAVGNTITVKVSAAGYVSKLTATTDVVAPKAVTATGGTVTKIYDGTPTATVPLSIAKVNESDEISIATVTGATYDDANAGENKTVTLPETALAITGAASGWYDVSKPETVTGTITPKPLTDAKLTVSGTYVYTGAAQTPNIVVKADNKTIEAIHYDISATENVDAGDATVIATFKGNYSGEATGTFTIARATPSITWGDHDTQRLTYTGSSAAITLPTTDSAPIGAVTYTYAVRSGDGNPAGAYQAGLPTNVGSYLVVASLAEHGNYFAAQSEPMHLTIEKATPALTLNAEKYTGKAYDGKAISPPTADDFSVLTGASMEQVAFAYSVNADMSSSTATAPTNAGTYYVRASVAAGDQCFPAQSEAVTFQITKIEPSITMTAPAEQMYGKEVTVHVAIAALPEVSSGYPEAVQISITNDADVVQTGSTTLVPGKTNEYTATFTMPGEGKIGQTVTFSVNVLGAATNYKPLATALTKEIKVGSKYVTTTTLAASKENLTYGESITLKATVTSAQSGGSKPAGQVQFMQGAGNLGDPVAIDPVTGIATLPVSKDKLTASGALPHSFTAAFTATGGTDFADSTASATTVTVAHAAMTGAATITGTAKFGETLQVDTATLSGATGDVLGAFAYQWKRADSPIDGATNSTYQIKEADIGKDITVEVTPGNQNYEAATSAAVTAQKAASTITLGEITKTYDGVAVSAPTTNTTGSDGTVAYSWYVGGDTTTTPLSAPVNAGTYTVKATLPANTTHDEATATATFTIAQATLRVTGYTVANKDYDGTNTATVSAVTFADMKNGETLALATDYTVSAQFANKDAGADIGVTGTVTLTTSDKAKNYKLSSGALTGKTAAIAQIAPTYQVVAQSILVGKTLTAITAPATGTGVGSESVAGTLQWALAQGGPALGDAYRFSGSVGSRVTLYWTFTPPAGNYKALTGSTAFTIVGKAVPTLTVDNIEKDYDGKAVTTVTGTAHVGDTPVAGSFGFDGAQTMQNANTYQNVSVKFTPDDATNYDSATTTITVTIKKVALTVKADDKTMFAGALKPEDTATTTGLVNGETIRGVTFTYSPAAPDTSTKGTFTITPAGGTISGGGNENYTISYQTGTGTIVVDVAVIDTAIAAANMAKQGVTVNDKAASSVASGTKFVTTEEMKALTDAIAAATAAKTTATTAAQAQVAATALDQAVATFTAAIKTGTYVDDNYSVSSRPPASTEPVNAEVKVTAVMDQNGNATASALNQAIVDAISTAKRRAGESGFYVTVNIQHPRTADSLTAAFSKASIDRMISQGANRLNITSGLTSLSFDLAALKSMQASVTESLTITMRKPEEGTLSAQAQAVIGNRPVFDLTMTSGSKNITEFGQGLSTVSIAYTLSEKEDPENVQAVYVNENGGVEPVAGSRYDPSSKTVVFDAPHLSIYGVAYLADAPEFADIANHWAKADVEFVAARGLMSGTSAATFSPDTGMTRGMFVTALGRLAGVDTSSYKTGKFADVEATAYYAPYVNWAASVGITSGTTATTFSPDKTITRQELATLMANFAAAMKYTLPKTNPAVSFADAGAIESWAAAAVEAMQTAGVMEGKAGNKFDPAGTATRAEVATVLHRYVVLVVDQQTR